MISICTKILLQIILKLHYVKFILTAVICTSYRIDIDFKKLYKIYSKFRVATCNLAPNIFEAALYWIYGINKLNAVNNSTTVTTPITPLVTCFMNFEELSFSQILDYLQKLLICKKEIV